MSERKYSVAEIDHLRQVVENKWLYGSYSPRFDTHSGLSRPFRENEKVNAVEQMVRTHMLAGHTAADLIASEKPE